MSSELKIIKSININAGLPAVWDVLINPVKIKQYYTGAETVTSWQVGSTVIFIHYYENGEFINKGVVLAYNPNQLLQYTYWTAFSDTEDKPENYTVITFTLAAADDTTRLTFTQTNFKNTAWHKALETGWDMVLDKIREIAELWNTNSL